MKEPGSMLLNSQLVGKWGGDNLSYVLHATLGSQIQIQSEIKEIQIQHIFKSRLKALESAES